MSTTINTFHAKYFVICEIKCKRWVISVATTGLAKHFQQFRISKWVSLLVWNWVRLLRLDYSRPVQGHFTSHDFEELPHMMFLYIAPIQKWKIWLGLYNFEFTKLCPCNDLEPEVTFDWPRCCMITKARPCRIPHVYVLLVHLLDPHSYSHRTKTSTFPLNGRHYPWVLAWTWESKG